MRLRLSPAALFISIQQALYSPVLFYIFLASIWIAIGYEISNLVVNRIIENHGSITELSKKKRPDSTRRNIDRFGEAKTERMSRRVIKFSLTVFWPFFLLKALWDALT